MPMDYDYIIAGGGCAGLSLAHFLNQSSLRNQKILILDPDPKTQNDKTWCFWADQPLPYQCAQETHWEEMEVIATGKPLYQRISPLRYVFVNSLEFYQEIKDQLEQNPQIHIAHERVKAIQNTPTGGLVETESGTYAAKWIFNSIMSHFERNQEHHFFLHQHFGGWFVKTDTPVFDRQRIRLMDFQVDQEQDTRFVYILPFGENEALVEYTVFSEQTWSRAAYDHELAQYLQQHFPDISYDITHREYGDIPMTNHPFPAQRGSHVINLGSAAGLTKPTTGYTFLNIQRHARQLVQALETQGTPVLPKQKKARFSFYDDLLLYIIRNDGARVRHIFQSLFSQNDFRTILRFLDERTSIWEEIPLLMRLPWGPFLNAIWQYKIKKNTGTAPVPSLHPCPSHAL